MFARILVSTALSVFLLVSTAAYAEECFVCQAANKEQGDNYWEGLAYRTKQGVTNIAFSWMEIVLVPTERFEPKGTPFTLANISDTVPQALGSIAEGVYHGIGSGAVRLGQGVGQVFTAPFARRQMPAEPCEVCRVEALKAEGIVS